MFSFIFLSFFFYFGALVQGRLVRRAPSFLPTCSCWPSGVVVLLLGWTSQQVPGMRIPPSIRHVRALGNSWGWTRLHRSPQLTRDPPLAQHPPRPHQGCRGRLPGCCRLPTTGQGRGGTVHTAAPVWAGSSPSPCLGRGWNEAIGVAHERALGQVWRKQNQSRAAVGPAREGSNEVGAGVVALACTLWGVCGCCGGRERGAGSQAGCARWGGASRFPPRVALAGATHCLERGFLSWHPPGHAQPRPPPRAV